MLLDTAVARGAEFMASQLPKARVIWLLVLTAREHATAAYGKEEKKQSAHMLLEHLLQRPGQRKTGIHAGRRTLSYMYVFCNCVYV